MSRLARDKCHSEHSEESRHWCHCFAEAVLEPPQNTASTKQWHQWHSGMRWSRYAILLVLLLAGCQQKMADQPSYKPLVPNGFFADGRSERPWIAGTVARGHLRTDTVLFTGRHPGANPTPLPQPDTNKNETATTQREDEQFSKDFPFAITPEILDYGRQRYMIYCVVCHDALGTGRGKIVERGYTAPPSYHIPRLRQAPVGRLFAVVTEGYGSMPSYGEQIPPRDRWAIVAYVRALQLSQHFPADQLSPEMRKEQDQQTAAPGGTAP